MEINKILVSGGWGYKNLGDDAILQATIKLIRQKFANAELVVASYDPVESKNKFSEKDIVVIPSVYRILFGNDFEKNYYTGCVMREKSLWNRIYDKLLPYLTDFKNDALIVFLYYFNFLFIKILKRLYGNIYESFYNVDLLIMAGGGYFNSWQESLLSRYLEIEIAKLNGAKVVLIGQTIGPFTKMIYQNIAKNCLNECDLISVRDFDSYLELKALGVNLEDTIIPDLALYDLKQSEKKDRLVFIPFEEGLREKGNEICKVFYEIQKMYNLEIVFTVSQLWNGPVTYAKSMYQYCLNLRCNASLVIPNNIDELQTLLGESKIVLSQNLHGLIMAFRAGSSIVCMNDKRKFKTFMEKINRSDMLVSMDTLNYITLKETILKCLTRKNDQRQRQTLAQQVETEFFRCLDFVIYPK